MQIHIVTVATSDKLYFKALKESCKLNDVNLKILGWGMKWTGYTMKINLIREFLKTMPNNDIVVFIDAYDVLVLKNLAEIKKRFISYDTPILFSEDIPNTIIKEYGYKKLFWGCKDNKYLCSGLYAGYVYALKLFYTELCLEYDCSDHANDQLIISRFCSSDFFTKYVKLDTENKVFLNIYSDKSPLIDNNIDLQEVLEYDPCIVHAPGNGNLNNVVEHFNFKYTVINQNNYEFYRSKIQDYAGFFIPEFCGIVIGILAILAIIIVCGIHCKK